jgi:hypothetical protein
MVAVREVIHGLELLIDNTDTRFMRAVSDILDIRDAFTHCPEFLIDNLRRFDRRLRVKLGYANIRDWVVP